MVLTAGKPRQDSRGWDLSRDHPESQLVSSEAVISQATEVREEQARHQQDWPLMASPDSSHFRRPSDKPTHAPLPTGQDISSSRRPTKVQTDISLTPAPLSVSPRSARAGSDYPGLQPQPTPDLYSYLVPRAQSQVENSYSLFPHPPSTQARRENIEPNPSCVTPTAPPTDPAKPDQALTSHGQEETFEKALRRNAAILCEVYV